ncbi:MAG: hypothetical protein AAF989_11540 [Planctomycetota bacterium]
MSKAVTTASSETDDRLKKLEAAQERNAEINRLERLVRKREADWKSAKQESSDTKKSYDKAMKELRDFIQDSASDQMRLDFDESKNPKSPESNPRTSSKSLSWRQVDIKQLKLAKKFSDELRENGINNLGDWDDLQSGRNNSYPNGAKEWKGWGDTRVNRINALVAKIRSEAEGPAKGQAPNDVANSGSKKSQPVTSKKSKKEPPKEEKPAATETPDPNLDSGDAPEGTPEENGADPQEFGTAPEESNSDMPVDTEGTVDIKILRSSSMLTAKGIGVGDVVRGTMNGQTAVLQFSDGIETSLMPNEFEAA